MTLGPPDPAPEPDVIDILLAQHQRARELLAEVTSGGAGKHRAFEDLRALLAAHEKAEESVVRPVTRQVAGDGVADARNSEEAHADKVLAALGGLDVSSAEFDAMFADFEQAVSAHAEHEETEEFPRIRAGRSREELVTMGRELLAAE
jgi:hemerythrin superfamily protein